jgi:uncharacterized repeat protein (TIGR03803 family)
MLLSGAATAQVVNLVSPTAFTESGVITDSAGNLYGTTQIGGTSQNCHALGCGTVFELSPNATGGWTLTTLYSFSGRDDGLGPAAGLVRDSAGNLYGTTQSGGGSKECAYGCGVIFRLSPSTGGVWDETVLYRFTGGSDGSAPVATLTLGSGGSLYGTASLGGASTGGLVFMLERAAGGWKQTVLHNFIGTDGHYPESPLTRDSAGNLYGTTAEGGSHNAGVVYRLAPSSSGWTCEILHNFTGGSDGQQPVGGLTFDASGNLYGTTQFGGNKPGLNGSGVVFRLHPSGNAWREAVLYTFTGGTDGANPSAGVTFDSAVNLYGTTSYGTPAGCKSSYGCGQVFQLTPAAEGWSLGALYPIPQFLPSLGGLTRDASGNLFFTASDQQSLKSGDVFELVP